MSVADLWKKNRAELSSKTIDQLLSICGNGKLLDDSLTSNEFRELLSIVSTESIQVFAANCLERKFDQSGFALQDIVNECGKRLGFSTKFGLYRGTQDSIGFDGLWASPNRFQIVVEVKTSDSFRIRLDTIAGYRKALIQNSSIKDEEQSSILLVVGRLDTADLEEQIRGSRHAWDIRVISVEALVNLLLVKEKSEDPATSERIRNILIPKEFTRLDEIIDLIFTTIEDTQTESEDDTDSEQQEDDTSADLKNSELFQKAPKIDECVERVESILDINLVRKSRSIYTNPDESLIAVCKSSRAYKKGTGLLYWYGFYSHQADILNTSTSSSIMLACGSTETIFWIPYDEFRHWIPGMHVTNVKSYKFYSHVKIINEADSYSILLNNPVRQISIDKFKL